MKILVLNCGSSSVKYTVFNRNDLQVIANGIVDEIGSKTEASHVNHTISIQGGIRPTV